MPAPRLLALVVLAVTGLLIGCGDKKSDEVSLGNETTSRAEQNNKRLDQLERRIAKLKRERANNGARPGGYSGAGGGLVTSAGRAAFDRLAQQLGGQVGVTVGGVGAADSQQLGPLTTGKAWSTIKLAIAGKVLEDAGGPSGLTENQRQSMTQALTASDNSAAARLFDGLKADHGGLDGASRAIGSVLREAGDNATVISTHGTGGFSTYGQTDWSLREQQRFMARLAGRCILKKGSAEYLLGLMGQVVAGQQWGLGSAGVPARFKGGWGPSAGSGYLVRQTGVLDLAGGNPVVVTIAAEPADGQFGSGTTMLTALAKWAATNIDVSAVPAGHC